jgi:hypothetical protein
MTKAKYLGIWMDHAAAHLTEFNPGPIRTRTVESKFTHQQKEADPEKAEHLMHEKEQHKQAEYYRALCEAIKEYDDVLLFGPTDAKLELYNLIKSDQLFANIKIEVKPADKMTAKEQHAFVDTHFSTR